jgi:integrase
LAADQITRDQNGNDKVVLHAFQTKGNASRLVYIPRQLANEMRALKASGNVPVEWRLRRIFYQARDACGVGNSITLHSLRHTTATRLMERGENMRTIQRFLGHKIITTTERYTHVNDDLLLEAAKKLSPTVGENSPNPQIIPYNPKKNAS